MVYILKDRTNGSFAYRIVQKIGTDGGPVQEVRVLAEETGFGHIGQCMTYIESLKESIAAGRRQNFRGVMGSAGVRFFDQKNAVLLEEEGYSNGEELESFVRDMKGALEEGVQVK